MKKTKQLSTLGTTKAVQENNVLIVHYMAQL